MKNYKKILLTIVLVFVLLLTVTACGSEEKVEGKVSDLIEKVNKDLPEDTKTRLFSTEVTSDNIQMFLGSNEIEYEEAVASENMVGSIAHSVILLRAKDGANIEDLKAQIKKSINPRKWICVWVEDEDVIIKNRGDLIIVIIVQDEDNRAIIEKGFDNL